MLTALFYLECFEYFIKIKYLAVFDSTSFSVGKACLFEEHTFSNKAIQDSLGD